MTFTSAGVLSGTPALVTGTYPITIMATDASGNTGTQSFTLVVGASGQLIVTTTSVPGATPGAYYQANLRAAGGPAPYKWKLASGKLPKGLKLNKVTGIISGVPNMKAVGTTFTVQVTDSAHPEAVGHTCALTIVVS